MVRSILFSIYPYCRSSMPTQRRRYLHYFRRLAKPIQIEYDSVAQKPLWRVVKKIYTGAWHTNLKTTLRTHGWKPPKSKWINTIRASPITFHLPAPPFPVRIFPCYFSYLRIYSHIVTHLRIPERIMQPQRLTLGESAEYLNISRKTMTELVKKNVIVFTRDPLDSRKKLFNIADLDMLKEKSNGRTNN
jgi:excisionase family DNA binding protein